MNDKKFDEWMYSALMPEIKDNEIQFLRKTEVRNSMRKSKIIKPVIAAVACVALILGVSKIPTLNSVRQNTESGSRTDTGIMEKIDNAFTVKVLAAENKDGKKEERVIQKDNPVPVIAAANSPGGCWTGDINTNEISYCMEAPLVCEGKNIEKITYSINKGAFQIFSPKGSGYILEGEKSKYMNVGENTPPEYEEEEEGKPAGVRYDSGYYTSYTVSPDFQISDDIRVSICDIVKVSEKTYKMLWESGRSLKKVKKGMDKIYEDLVITCEVTYKDGTKESVDVAIGTAIMTDEEAGFEVEAPEKNTKSVYTTFQMK